MQFILRTVLKCILRLLLKPVFSSRVPIKLQRVWMRVMTASSLPPRGTSYTNIDMNGVQAEGVCVDANARRTVLYLHGGGYCIGSPATHRALAARIARAAGAISYVPAYRLAPEYPHPAALNDAVAAYRWLLTQNHSPQQIVIAGDSAGGGLALCLALALRDLSLPPPAALVLISPWVDLTLSGKSMQTHARRDPMLSFAITELWSLLYTGTHPAAHPLCSPLFANPTGLSPMLIQTGSEEILLSDSMRLAGAARTAGVAVQLHEYPGLWHDFQLQAGVLRDADAAIAEIGEFIKHHAPA